MSDPSFNPLWINTALKPCRERNLPYRSFNPLWINTALKRTDKEDTRVDVSIPYGLTLLSNDSKETTTFDQFQSPMD